MRAPYLICGLLLVAALLPSQADGAEDELAFEVMTRAEVDEVATANGFCRGQEMTTAAIATANLAKGPAVQLELARFSRETGGGCKELERALKTYLQTISSGKADPTKVWREFSENVDGALAAQMKKAYPQGFDDAAADRFLSELSARRKGKMDGEILGTILSASREYRVRPELEIARGFGEVFATTGLVKSRGIRMQLKLPISWKGKDGDGPRVVQKWTSRINRSGAVATVILMAIPASAAEIAEIRGQFTTGVLPEEFHQILPGEADVEATDRIQLMFRPALRASFTLQTLASDKSVVQKNFLYLALTDRGIVTLQCGVVTAGDPSQIGMLFGRYKPVCEMIATSMLDLSHIRS